MKKNVCTADFFIFLQISHFTVHVKCTLRSIYWIIGFRSDPYGLQFRIEENKSLVFKIVICTFNSMEFSRWTHHFLCSYWTYIYTQLILFKFGSLRKKICTSKQNNSLLYSLFFLPNIYITLIQGLYMK